jgi:hypothetical protein
MKANSSKPQQDPPPKKKKKSMDISNLKHIQRNTESFARWRNQV